MAKILDRIILKIRTYNVSPFPFWIRLVMYSIPSIIFIISSLLLWELYIAIRDIDIIIAPPPSAIWDRFWDSPEFFLEHGGWTLYESFLGLLLGSAIAMGCAVAMTHSHIAEKTILPTAILVKVTPIVAISPILVTWFGLGNIMPKIIIAALISFFPLLINAMTGFRSMDPNTLSFFRTLDASKWQIFFKLRLPSSMPYLFSALKVTIPLSIIGAVVAEWFSGNHGLGLIIFVANNNLDTPTVFAAIGVLSATNPAMFVGV